MTGEEVSETEEAEVTPPTPTPEEKPLFDLGDLLKGRRGKGEGVGFWEVLAYLDYKDRREEREWRRDEREAMKKNAPSSSTSPDVEALKKQVSELQETVTDLVETIHSERLEKTQKEFVEGVVKQTTEKILPEVQRLGEKLAELESRTTPAEAEATSDLTDIREEIKGLADKIGEKVGKAGLTLEDVDSLLGVIERLEKRMGKTATGEVDAKTMAITTAGELGKELICAYRDISTSPERGVLEAPPTETPATTMQAIIKRQVQNYITQRMKQGATTMNIQEAAKDLGLTPGQVTWAYQTLMKEGWFHVHVPSKGKKVKEPGIPKEGEEISPPTETPEEGEQVFNPPET